MPIINHIMITEKGEVDLEKLARKHLPPAEEYPDWKYHRLAIPVTPQMHKIKGLEGDIQCVYQIRRADLVDKASWVFVHCRKKTYKEVRKGIRERAERKKKLREGV